jgi:16S rRNA (cytosine967-C5)-methyltransferase
MTSARLAAVKVLAAVERGRTTLAGEMDRARPEIATGRDRSLFFEIVAGTLRWRSELDEVLARCSNRPLAGLDANVRAIVRLGAYQLRHLDRVPVHAVVHESVELARALGHPRASGFVNAVLRTLWRDRARLALPERPPSAEDAAASRAYLSVTLSHPAWLIDRWLARYPFDAVERWCQFNNAPPDVTIRPIGDLTPDGLRRALEAAGVAAMPARFVSDAMLLLPGTLTRLPPALRASVVIQEEASQIVAHAVGARPGERVLDVCAAPGGKTVLLAAAMGGSGMLVAGDVRPARVRLLSSTLARARIAAPILQLDALGPLPFDASFDRVFVDVPCSGLGTLRRDPDLKWSRQPDDLPRFAEAELHILANAARAVRPGGALIYATCSSEPQENDEVVDRFLDGQPDFAEQPVRLGPAVGNATALVDRRGRLRTLPFRDDLDAFFAAAFLRKQ